MFQVLLVDDEALARNDIKSMLDWEKHGFTICGEAQNGVIALSFMERQAPHIAILDVSMPTMNGLELSGIIRDRFPKVKMIMLSSFDDYDYVRACLKNGAMDYLLKHRLNSAALLALLNKAVQDLKEEEKENETRSAQTRMLERLSPVIHREYAANLTRDESGTGEELETYARDNQLYVQCMNYAAAAVQIVPFQLLTEALTDVQKNRFVQRAMDVMQMAIGDIHKQTVAYVGEGRFIVLFSSADRSEHTAVSQIKQALSNLAHSVEKFLNLKCVYAIGTLCGSLRQLGLSYGKANKEINDLLNPGMSTAAKREALFMEEQKQLLLYLEQLDEERMKGVISSIFASLPGLPVYSATIQGIVSQMLHMADISMKRHLPNGFIEDHKLTPARSEFGRMEKAAELERWLIGYFTRIMEAMKKQYAGGNFSRHISKAVQFIMDHHASDISLDTTASALNLNPSYFSRLFKEETQMTFTEYLNRIRIKASCSLMESGVCSFKQISSQVGFANYTYFFKVFKTITGMTPQAYMDQLKESNK
ncbi:response regulator [Paenibacillus sp. N4]|uniref:response regulator transcription factor n=1 Tax=Paenibacillus vietnamensis TaxID=2590547 RepID=UPI001CD1908D|nr:response regulator [Paenibacillus vietnamensis]MCA0757881.1 response regulator [Paenibacillus vietnamensis]